VTTSRLEVTIARLQERLRLRAAAPGPGDMAAVIARMQSISMAPTEPMEAIKVIRAGVGNTVRMIPIADVICFEATDKYVTVVSAEGEALVRMSMRELMTRIDTTDFKQIHRSVVVNINHIASATRDDVGHYTLSVRGMKRTLKVSRAFSHLFRPM
jgi:DNA-binding LytR/AlgR family response regulator